MKNVQPTEVPEGAQLIDVRENDEWAVERAKGATHIPMSEITGRIQEIDPDKDIYVICHAGGRSMQAASIWSMRWAGTPLTSMAARITGRLPGFPSKRINWP